MNFAVSTQVFENEVLTEDHLALLKNSGFDDIEIFLTLPHFDWHDEGFVASTEAAIKKLGLAVRSMHAPWMPNADIASLDGGERDRSVKNVKKAVEVLEKLKGEILVIHPGAALQQNDDIAEKLRHSQESLAGISTFCQAHDIQIALENPPDNELGGNPENLKTLHDLLPQKNIFAAFDTGHAHISGGLDLWHQIRKDKIYVHLHDNDGKRDLHLPPAKGSFDWQAFFELIKQSKFQGIITLELTPVENAAEVLRTSRRWLDEMAAKYNF